ncbi:hypothetical protein PUR57_05280 [Streptomyces sp. JV176]|uniref:hypothetical protein n=1 Tax=Streptomyces sp. JV176 TaxID=858630 RepID=UPI002E7A237F|nr:hypothetical protein [Streptomyces sp. JV176]MEE1798094.1 hypothetical protein [Streptomyces sp. JV176]
MKICNAVTPPQPAAPAPVGRRAKAAPAPYFAPSVTDHGTVTAVTLGHAGSDKKDDTQYYSSW